MSEQKLFNELLIFVNLYQHAKNEVVSSTCSGEMLDSELLQTEWIRVFWPVSLEQHFSQREDLYRNTANNIHSHYRGNSEEKYLARFPNF